MTKDPGLNLAGIRNKVYCIVVTYNGDQWIEKCLSSLVNSSYPITPIIIDNGSTDLTLNILRSFPDVRLIETGKNLGFGAANNIGLDIALEEGADYIFLLNQDAWVEPQTIEKLILAMHQHQEYGILSPLHLNGSGKQLDTNFARYLSNSSLYPFLNAALVNPIAAPEIINTSFVNAAAWMLSRDCVEKTGGFDPIFFHYGEDVNYCQRVLFKNFKIGIYLPTKIYHDRANRPKGIPDINQKVKDEKIHFLNLVCNPAQTDYRQIIRKRFLRYLLTSIKNILLFNRAGFYFSYAMTKMIYSSAASVKNSRINAVKDFPHLRANKNSKAIHC